MEPVSVFGLSLPLFHSQDIFHSVSLRSSLFAHRFWISSILSGQILGESTARETTIHVVDAPIDSEPSWQLQMAFQRTTTTRSRKIPPNCAQFGV